MDRISQKIAKPKKIISAITRKKIISLVGNFIKKIIIC